MNALKTASATLLAVAILTMLSACNRTPQSDENVTNAKPYPLDTCLVCGMKLSMMGKPFTFVYQGQQIKVCDEGEKAEFEKEPAKYLKKLEEAGLH